MNDEEIKVRMNLYKVFVGVSFLSAGIEKIIAYGFVPKLWSKVCSEDPQVQASIFHVLSKLAIQKDIEAFEACTLVMLSMGTF